MRKALFLLLASLCLLTGCGQMGHNQEASAQPEQRPAASTSQSETGAPPLSSVELIYSPASLQKPMEAIPPIDDEKILIEEKIDNVRVIIYGKEEDPDNYYLSVESGSQLYDAAVIGFTALKADDFTINSAEAFSVTYIKVTGAVGANAPVTVYMAVHQADSPVSITIDAHTEEADIDEDGIKEIIGTVGTAAAATIYKLTGSGYGLVNLNELLNAQVVLYDKEDNRFNVNILEDAWSTWEVIGGKLQLAV